MLDVEAIAVPLDAEFVTGLAPLKIENALPVPNSAASEALASFWAATLLGVALCRPGKQEALLPKAELAEPRPSPHVSALLDGGNVNVGVEAFGYEVAKPANADGADVVGCALLAPAIPDRCLATRRRTVLLTRK